jgi:hypothetical protein
MALDGEDAVALLDGWSDGYNSIICGPGALLTLGALAGQSNRGRGDKPA